MNGGRRATSGALVAVMIAIALLLGGSPALATGRIDGTRICGTTESTPVAGGRYEVQNNVWGADTPQCVTAFDTGFVVDPADHHNTDQPAAYPSIWSGCNYGTCTKDSPFPRPLADLGDVRSSWSITVPPTGNYNAAYDIWLDPTPRRTDRPTGLELMIWLKSTGGIAPIGEKKGEVEIGGARYDVWQGDIDLPVISYVRQQETLEVRDLPISDFVTDATNRGVAQRDWYLTSVQAGFEPWTGGAGLTTTSFSVTRNGV